MKCKAITALSIAVFSFAFISPRPAQAKDAKKANDSPNVTTASAGESEALQMVPARAILRKTLDAKDAKSGKVIRATLADTIYLKNGPELPSGTKLIGTVAADDMHVDGTSKLALRFTTAKLRDGKTIPIKATIVGVFPPESMNAEGYPVAPGDQASNTWTSQTLQVDQIGALSGVDLHSKIASRNSGVLVSTKKDDVKLRSGTEVALAIAKRS
jgi:hypothetical protein